MARTAATLVVLLTVLVVGSSRPLFSQEPGEALLYGEDMTVYGSLAASSSPTFLGPVVATELVTGWNNVCYLGPPQPVELALAPVIEDVQAVYRLGTGQSLEAWFPGRPEVSTIVNLGSYEAVFILMTENATWSQPTAWIRPASLDLAPGWNSICYTGKTMDAEAATEAIGDRLGVVYALEPGQTWMSFVPGRPEVSNLVEFQRSTPALLLVTGQETINWAFSPSDIEPAPGYEATMLFQTEIRLPWDLAIGGSGELYVADDLGRKVARVDQTGEVTTLATLPGPLGPRGVALDSSGELFVMTPADIYRIRPGGDLQHFVSHADFPRVPGAGGVAFSEIELGPSGDLFTVDEWNGGVYRIAPDGSASLLASTGAPVDLALSPDGELYVADKSTNQVLKVGMDGTVTPFASGEFAPLGILDPLFIAFSPTGDLYVSGLGGIFTISPEGETSEFEIGGQSAREALGVWVANSLAFDPAGNLYLTDGAVGRITRVSPDGEATVLMPGFNPSGIAVAPDGDVVAVEKTGWPVLFGTVLRFGSDGTIRQEFAIDEPLADVDVAVNGDVFVRTSGCILKMTGDGPPVEKTCDVTGWGKVAISPLGEVFATSVETGEIVRVTDDGLSPFISGFDWSGVSTPGIDFDGAGNLYVVNARDSSVLKFDPLGQSEVLAYLEPVPLTEPTIAVSSTGETFVLAHGFMGTGFYAISRITLDGQVSQFANGVLLDPYGIDVGPDGSVYISRSGSIDRITAQ
jgi:DNA-binding beta-propeller fold protein YncE